MNHSIKFYPVGNGDCCLVSIGGANKKMMFDCNFRQKAENEDNEMFDVLGDLIDNQLKVRCGLHYLDAFLLTHPDEDHCRGFAEKFYLGDPDSISDDDKDANKILISELWYSPRVFEEYTTDLSDDAKAFKKEAKRRMELYKTDKKKAEKEGNRIRIIGWTDAEELKGLEDRITVPGHIVNEVNGHDCKHFEMFIHAPFKDSIKNGSRNESSIVSQLRFKFDKNYDIVRVFLAGDAEWYVWENIMAMTKNDDYLKWDLLEAPHHCSYTFFAEKREDEPKQASIDFLGNRESGAFVVSSSKVIKQNDDNPPCQKAKNRYVKKVGDGNFFCTSGTSEDEADTPLVFDIEDGELGLHEDKVKPKVVIPPVRDTKPHFYGETF
ncbi:MAG: hypothetical protein J5862_05610 [Bacteroidales bacterium]|nr:hypothetical protein [Bacteroidales bacterium]